MSSEIERYRKHIENWVDSLDSEISYWNYAMREMGGEFFVYWENLVKPNKPFVYENFLKSLGDSQKEYKFIDVGSGPCFAGGTVTKDISVDIRAVDPLGYLYNRLRKDYGVHSDIDIETGFVECLDKKYSANTFDMVTMNNSLDHSFDPIQGIKELLYIAKIGGIVRLCHKENEAEWENYQGLHQWNISLDNSEKALVIWNKKKRINVSKELEGFAEFSYESKKDPATGDCWNTVILKKSRDISVDSSAYYDSMLEIVYSRLLMSKLKYAQDNQSAPSPTDLIIRQMRSAYTENKNCFNDYLQKNGSVVIYGMGAIGRALYLVCEKLNVEVRAMLDIKADESNPYVNPDEYKYDGTSLIIVTVLRDKEKVIKKMIEVAKNPAKIIYVEDMLSELESK